MIHAELADDHGIHVGRKRVAADARGAPARGVGAAGSSLTSVFTTVAGDRAASLAPEERLL